MPTDSRVDASTILKRMSAWTNWLTEMVKKNPSAIEPIKSLHSYSNFSIDEDYNRSMILLEAAYPKGKDLCESGAKSHLAWYLNKDMVTQSDISNHLNTFKMVRFLTAQCFVAVFFILRANQTMSNIKSTAQLKELLGGFFAQFIQLNLQEYLSDNNNVHILTIPEMVGFSIEKLISKGLIKL